MRDRVIVDLREARLGVLAVELLHGDQVVAPASRRAAVQSLQTK